MERVKNVYCCWHRFCVDQTLGGKLYSKDFVYIFDKLFYKILYFRSPKMHEKLLYFENQPSFWPKQHFANLFSVYF